MTPRLERFFVAKDLDEAAGLAIERADLSALEEAAVRRALTDDANFLARRNLLLHPEAIPGDLLVGALVAGLESEDQRVVLAAVVGSHQAGTDISEAGREALIGQLIKRLPASNPTSRRPSISPVIRRRVSAALMVLSSPAEASSLLPYLSDGDPVVRHNVRAALVRVLGARGALAAVKEAHHEGAVAADAVGFVDDGVEGGSASNRDLLLRGVLAPQLVPITELSELEGGL